MKLLQINEDNSMKYKIRALKNHLSDIARKNKVRSDTSIYNKLDNTPETIENIEECMFTQETKSQFEEYSIKEFKSILLKWSETQDTNTRKFITEYFNISKEVEDKWMKIKKSPRYNNLEEPPVTTLCNILGINKSLKYKILKKIKAYLLEINYSRLN